MCVVFGIIAEFEVRYWIVGYFRVDVEVGFGVDMVMKFSMMQCVGGGGGWNR